MKLQKLVYFAHAWHLGYREVPLLNEQVEAWDFGPVVPSLYKAVKHYGNSNVKELIRDFDFLTLEYEPAKVIDSSDAICEFLDSIWTAYKGYTGVQLSNITHIPGSPWHKIFEAGGTKRRHTDIPDDLIKEYFAGIIQQRNQGAPQQA